MKLFICCIGVCGGFLGTGAMTILGGVDPSTHPNAHVEPNVMQCAFGRKDKAKVTPFSRASDDRNASGLFQKAVVVKGYYHFSKLQIESSDLWESKVWFDLSNDCIRERRGATPECRQVLEHVLPIDKDLPACVGLYVEIGGFLPPNPAGDVMSWQLERIFYVKVLDDQRDAGLRVPADR
jgi:hypothetical protein